MIRTVFHTRCKSYMELSDAQMAVVNWLFAKKHHGEFVVSIIDRHIDDSDSISIDRYLRKLNWLGINPNIGPIIRNNRTVIYQEKALALTEKKKAYLEKSQFNYSKDEKNNRMIKLIKEDMRDNEFLYKDPVAGNLRHVDSSMSDIVIIYADGKSSDEFANVIDNIEVGVTHVIRDISDFRATATEIGIYDALGVPHPCYMHFSAIGWSMPQDITTTRGGMTAREYNSLDTLVTEGFCPTAVSTYFSGAYEQSPCSLLQTAQRFELSNLFKSPIKKLDKSKLAKISAEFIKCESTESLAKNCFEFCKSFLPIEFSLQDAIKYLSLIDKISILNLKSYADLARYIPYEFTMFTSGIIPKELEDYAHKSLNTFATRLSAFKKITSEDLYELFLYIERECKVPTNILDSLLLEILDPKKKFDKKEIYKLIIAIGKTKASQLIKESYRRLEVKRHGINETMFSM